MQLGPVMLTPTLDHLHLISEGSQLVHLELRNLFIRHFRCVPLVLDCAHTTLTLLPYGSPTQSVRSSPRQWWLYAFRSIIHLSGQPQRRKLGFLYVVQTLRLRRQYIDLFK